MTEAATQDSNPREVIGANNPPGPVPPVFPTADDLTTFLISAFKEITDKALDIRVGMKKVPAIDAKDVAERATSFVVQAKEIAKRLEKDRVAQKGPIDALSAVVQAWFKALQDPLCADIKELEKKLGVYDAAVRSAEAERQRLQREAEAKAAADAALEQERLQMEADLAAERAQTPEQRAEAAAAIQKAEDAKKVVTLHEKAAAKPIATTAVRGSLGGVGVASGRWTFEVTDLSLVPREWLVVDQVKVNQSIAGKDGLRTIPGLRIFQAQNFSVRALT